MKRKSMGSGLCASALSIVIMVTGCSLGEAAQTSQEIEETSAAEVTTTTEETTQALEIADLIIGSRFRGNTYNRLNNEYRDISMIDYVVDLQSIASEREWTYGYRIDIDGETFAQEPSVTVSDTDELTVQLSTDGIFEAGHLYIEVTDEFGNVINTGECDIIVTPPVGTSAIPQIEIEEDGSFMIPGTDFRFHPNTDDYYRLDPMDVDFRTRSEQLGVANAIYLAMYEDDGIYRMCGYSIDYIGEYDYYNLDYSDEVDRRFVRQLVFYDNHDIPYVIDHFDVEIGGETFTVYSIVNDPSGSDAVNAGDIPVTCFIMFFGNENVTYTIAGVTPEEDAAHAMIERITFEGD